MEEVLLHVYYDSWLYTLLGFRNLNSNYHLNWVDLIKVYKLD